MPSSRTRPPFCLLASLAAAAPASHACGPIDTGVGSTHARRGDEAVVLHLRTTDDRVVAIEDQRGSQVLLAVLATYDGVSQAAMRPLSRYARDHEDVVVLAVLAQPDAATFAPLFERAMEAPFTIAWDPNDGIARGVSDLGPLEAVPSYFQIDREGRVAERHVGFMSEGDLERFME
ncbi:MAG: TlpA family protein disulfide reductase [Deltaproteobacteria bacterium]|nr:TlpA family protein disulfide reductase [Deltaproteobacteria bacterium]